MDLNQLISSSRIVCDDGKAFQLDINYIDMQEMDFDLSKKDQDSPQNYDFVEIVCDKGEMNDKKRD